MAKAFKSCAVSECNQNAHWSAKGYRGWCSKHYQRWKRYGDPLGGSTFEGEPLRFIHEVALTYDGDDCLPWPFGRDADGRGSVVVNGKARIASRYICTLAHGEPPTPKHEAAHSCGRGHLACVHPGHLSWKTPVENAADKVIHGTVTRGERHGNAKLTAADVLRIRTADRRGLQPLSIELGVTCQRLREIRRGKGWAWLQ